MDMISIFKCKNVTLWLHDLINKLYNKSLNLHFPEKPKYFKLMV